MKKVIGIILAILLFNNSPVFAASYSSGGGRSYSSGGSSSSRSSGGSSYSSPSRSYSPPSSSRSNGSSYSSPSTPSRSYSSPPPSSPKGSSSTLESPWSSPSTNFDSRAGRATQQQQSTKAYQRAHPPVIERQSGTTTVRVPREQYYSRQSRMQQQFGPAYYQAQPTMVYHDSFNPWFWMWLMSQNNDQQAEWAYHHHDEMDSQRYQDLISKNADLAAKVATLEASGKTKDLNYIPEGVDPDLIYADSTVQEASDEGVNWPIVLGGLIALVLAMIVISKIVRRK